MIIEAEIDAFIEEERKCRVEQWSPPNARAYARRILTAVAAARAAVSAGYTIKLGKDVTWFTHYPE